MQFQNHIKWCLYFRAKTFRKKTGGIGYVEKPATFFLPVTNYFGQYHQSLSN